MPRSTATTRRRAALVALAGLLAGGVWLWQGGLSAFGVTAPGKCNWTYADGSTAVLGVPESVAQLQSMRDAGIKLEKAAVSCSLLPASGGAPELSPRGLTANGERLFAAVENEFGRVSYGGFEPGGANSGHVANSDHYSGRAIDFFFRPYEKPAKRLAGWQLAQWAVVNAERLDITLVIFDEQIWSRNTSALGWRPYTHPDGPTDNAIKRHLDHVHISVG